MKKLLILKIWFSIFVLLTMFSCSNDDETNFDDYKRICYPVYYKGLDFGQEINPTLYTKKEWEQAPPTMFKYNVKEEGIAI